MMLIIKTIIVILFVLLEQLTPEYQAEYRALEITYSNFLKLDLSMIYLEMLLKYFYGSNVIQEIYDLLIETCIMNSKISKFLANNWEIKI